MAISDVPLHTRGKAELSARWRRVKRNPRKLNVFRPLSSAKNKKTSQSFRFRSPRIKGQSRLYSFKTPRVYGERRKRDPEPLIDVFEEKDEIVVIAEFAGFKRENLRTNVKNQRLILSAETLDRKYYKSLNLPKRVIPETIHAAYKNGVLEIRCKKTVEEKSVDRLAGQENAS